MIHDHVNHYCSSIIALPCVFCLFHLSRGLTPFISTPSCHQVIRHFITCVCVASITHSPSTHATTNDDLSFVDREQEKLVSFIFLHHFIFLLLFFRLFFLLLLLLHLPIFPSSFTTSSSAPVSHRSIVHLAYMYKRNGVRSSL